MKVKFLRSQAGFTLVEIMVTVGVLSLLALALINQTQIAGKVKISSSENAIINGLIDKVTIELSREATCTNNFVNKSLTTTRASAIPITTVLDGANNPILQVGAIYKYGSKTGGVSSSASNLDLVQVKQMVMFTETATTYTEFKLGIIFTKNSLGGGTPVTLEEIDLPFTAIPSALNGTAVVKKCFNDVTASIVSAIRLSCQGNNVRYEDPVTYPPYGRCVSDMTPQACLANQFIKTITLSNGALTTVCSGMNDGCTGTQVLTGFAANGTPTCVDPLPTCAAGQFLVRNSSNGFNCIGAGAGCGANSAIQYIDSAGIHCAPYYTPNSCTSYATNSSPSGVTCAPAYKSITCPPGQFVQSTDSSGNPSCAPWVNIPASCSPGYGATGIDASGNLTCQLLTRKLSCLGSVSASRTYKDCTNAGGIVQNYGTTNAFCSFGPTVSSCPGGFSQCSNYRYTQNASCTDTNSACSYSVSTRTVAGSNAFTNPVTPQSVQCYYWARNSGAWVKSCSQFIGPSNTTPTIMVGCY